MGRWVRLGLRQVVGTWRRSDLGFGGGFEGRQFRQVWDSVWNGEVVCLVVEVVG